MKNFHFLKGKESTIIFLWLQNKQHNKVLYFRQKGKIKDFSTRHGDILNLNLWALNSFLVSFCLSQWENLMVNLAQMRMFFWTDFTFFCSPNLGLINILRMKQKLMETKFYDLNKIVTEMVILLTSSCLLTSPSHAWYY